MWFSALLVLGMETNCVAADGGDKPKRTPSGIAADPSFLSVDPQAAKFRSGSVSPTDAKKPYVSVTVIENTAYRGRVGVRVEAKTDEEALNRVAFSYYCDLTPQARGRQLRMSMTIHFLSGFALFEQRPRQYRKTTSGDWTFLGKNTRLQPCFAGESHRIEQVVPLIPAADEIDYYFWFNSSHAFTAEIESLDVELVREPPVTVQLMADTFPAGTPCVYGTLTLSPSLWAAEGRRPAGIEIALESPKGGKAACMNVKAPASPNAAAGVLVATPVGFVLEMPEKVVAGEYAAVAAVKDAAGRDLAQGRTAVTVQPDYLPMGDSAAGRLPAGGPR
jgi:hypothetical protein